MNISEVFFFFNEVSCWLFQVYFYFFCKYMLCHNLLDTHLQVPVELQLSCPGGSEGPRLHRY